MSKTPRNAFGRAAKPGRHRLVPDRRWAQRHRALVGDLLILWPAIAGAHDHGRDATLTSLRLALPANGQPEVSSRSTRRWRRRRRQELKIFAGREYAADSRGLRYGER